MNKTLQNKEEKKAVSSNSSKVKVTKDMNLADILFKYPDVAEVLLDYGLHCVGCFANSFDTIEAGAKIHGMSDEEVDEMVLRVNEVIEFGE
jgi:hybrid cluster-associated redox disulfide protein